MFCKLLQSPLVVLVPDTRFSLRNTLLHSTYLHLFCVSCKAALSISGNGSLCLIRCLYTHASVYNTYKGYLPPLCQKTASAVHKILNMPKELGVVRFPSKGIRSASSRRQEIQLERIPAMGLFQSETSLP